MGAGASFAYLESSRSSRFQYPETNVASEVEMKGTSRFADILTKATVAGHASRAARVLSAFAMLAMAPASADQVFGPAADFAKSGKTIHQIELERHRDQVALPFRDRLGLKAYRRDLMPTGSPQVSREVLGFLPYWVSDGNLRWDLLTTLAYFAVEAKSDGSIGSTHGWPDLDLVSAAHANGVRVVLVVTNFSESGISSILGSSANRGRLISNLYSLVNQGGADGVNIDFEGVSKSVKANLVTFMKELTAYFEARMAAPHITIDTPAVDWSGAFDYDELAMASDGLMIMGYGYHWSGSTYSGPVAPLQGWGTYNLKWTISDYMQWGGSQNRDKFVLGLPWYGYKWATEDALPKSPTEASGSSVTYAGAKSGAAAYGRLWDEEGLTPWYTYRSGTQDYQVWYDDAESNGWKYQEVNNQDLGGIGIWALGYEGSSADLWNPIETYFGDPATSTVTAR
ncbi:MAG: hypothetical protein HYV63_21610 [Candidatus Schekmanbacteria bacterium]|nr:hypothetical protein [Candidatus Schekmanbacteria bacterium]